MGSAVDHKEK